MTQRGAHFQQIQIGGFQTAEIKDDLTQQVGLTKETLMPDQLKKSDTLIGNEEERTDASTLATEEESTPKSDQDGLSMKLEDQNEDSKENGERSACPNDHRMISLNAFDQNKQIILVKSQRHTTHDNDCSGLHYIQKENI